MTFPQTRNDYEHTALGIYTVLCPKGYIGQKELHVIKKQ